MPPEENPADNEQMTEEEFNAIQANNEEQPVEEAEMIGTVPVGFSEELDRTFQSKAEVEKNQFFKPEGFRPPGKSDTPTG